MTHYRLMRIASWVILSNLCSKQTTWLFLFNLFRNLFVWFFALALTVNVFKCFCIPNSVDTIHVEHDVTSSPKSNARLLNWGYTVDLDIYIRIVNMVPLIVGNLGRQRTTERTSLKYNPVNICWLFSKKVIYASDAEPRTWRGHYFP
jgi:hypothetical protein